MSSDADLLDRLHVGLSVAIHSFHPIIDLPPIWYRPPVLRRRKITTQIIIGDYCDVTRQQLCYETSLDELAASREPGDVEIRIREVIVPGILAWRALGETRQSVRLARVTPHTVVVEDEEDQ